MTLCNGPFEADLHNHTRHSDGEFTVDTLVKEAVKLGLRVLSITDHDTIDGIPEALEKGKQYGIDIICGVEITLRFTESFFRGSLHLLVYFAEAYAGNPEFTSDITAVMAQGRGAALTRSRLNAINAVFGPDGTNPLLPRQLLESDIYRHGHRISRRHFALALNDLGFQDKTTVAQIIGNDSPAYIPSGVPVETLKPFLEKWPVAAVLAHPAAGSCPGDSHYKEVLPPLETVEKLLPIFMNLGIQGFEICYPGHTATLVERLLELHQNLGLTAITGGSDCHDAEHRPLGTSGIGMDHVDHLKTILNSKR